MERVNQTLGQETKRCPYCAEEIRRAAVKCRHCGSWLEQGSRSGLHLQWYRRRQGKMVAGVCAGLADYYAIPVEAVRLAAVVLTLIGGWGLILYVVLWILMPYRDQASAPEGGSEFGGPPAAPGRQDPSPE